MRKLKIIFTGLVFLTTVCTGASASTIGLFDWGLNLNGDKYLPGDTLPATVDSSSFDFSTGLGTISFSYLAPANMNYSATAFFDHEIDEITNTFFNEYGVAVGTPATGQSWEIDEPGYLFGDIYWNFEDGMLDNSNAVPLGSEDDVSMSLDWDFSLIAGQSLMIDFLVSETAPSSGFYLTHTDPNSNASLYFSSTVVPEPGTFFLLASGIAGLLLWRRKRC